MNARYVLLTVVLLSAAFWIGTVVGGSEPPGGVQSAPSEPTPRATVPDTVSGKAPVLVSGVLPQARELKALRARVDELEAALARAQGVPKETTAPAPSGPKRKPTGRVLLDRLHASGSSDLASVESLELRGVTLSSRDIELLAGLPALRRLNLRGTNADDDVLVALSRLSLEHLDLRGTAVTGDGLHHMSHDLVSLHLTDTKIAPEDVTRLPILPRLRTLKLNGIKLGDEAIEHIGSYPQLNHLEVDRTAITGQGLRRLLELNSTIRRIEARSTPVDGKALQEVLSGHRNVQVVIRNNQWTVRGR